MPDWRERLDRYRNPGPSPRDNMVVANRQDWVNACKALLKDLKVEEELSTFQRDLLDGFGKVEGPLTWDNVVVGSNQGSRGLFGDYFQRGLTVAYLWRFCQPYYEQVATKWKTELKKITYEVQGNSSGTRYRHQGTERVQVPIAYKKVQSEECREILIEALYSPNPDSLSLRARGTWEGKQPPRAIYTNDYRGRAVSYLTTYNMPVMTDTDKEHAAEELQKKLLEIYSHWDSRHWLPKCIADLHRKGKRHEGKEHK